MSEGPPTNAMHPGPAPAYRDRRTGLILFGVVEIVLGALSLVMAGLLVLGQMMAARETGMPVSMQMVIPGLLFCAGMAVVFVWLGVGSIQCRRWARALSLMLAWVWLTTGVIAVPMMAWFMPKILASAPAGGQAMPAEAMMVVVVVLIVLMSAFFILLPGVLVLFYRSLDVKATCEVHDPVPRWTDSVPPNVLAVTCLLWSCTALMVALPLARLAVFPFFGVLLTGWAGSLLMIAMACVFFWIGWTWYRRDVAGWWVLLVVILVFSVSNALTFARVDVVEVYQKLGYPQAQLDLIRQQGWMTRGFMMWNSVIWLLVMLGYLVWAKRFFRGTDAAR